MGKAKASTAPARKLNILVYRTLNPGLPYHVDLAEAELERRARVLRPRRRGDALRAVEVVQADVLRGRGELLWRHRVDLAEVERRSIVTRQRSSRTQ